MPIDQEKLAKLQKMSANNKVGGTRRKQSKKTGNSNKDDSKLAAQLASLHATTMDNVAEANFFKEDGKVLHFNRVGVQTAPQSNVSAVYGIPQEKNLQELFPNIISQLGAESIQALTQLAAQLSQNAPKEGEANAAEGQEEIPSLVEGQDDVE